MLCLSEFPPALSAVSTRYHPKPSSLAAECLVVFQKTLMIKKKKISALNMYFQARRMLAKMPAEPGRRLEEINMKLKLNS